MKYIGSFLSGIMLFAAAAFNAGAQNDATFLNYADNERSISMGGASMAMSANVSSIMNVSSMNSEQCKLCVNRS